MTKVGTLEKRNPLPAGQYWIDVFGLNIPKFDAWLRSFGPFGVHTDATQHFEAPNVQSVRNWYKFTFKPAFEGAEAAVVWDTTFGFPTVADSSITSSEDTVQRPDLPLDPLDELSNWINSVEQKLGGSLGTIAGVVPYAIIGVGVLAGYLIVKDSFSTARKVKKLGKRN